MSKELLEALEQIGRGRKIDRKLLVKALEFAISTASKKAFGIERPIRLELDEKSGMIRAFTKKKVVSKVKNSKLEVALEDLEEMTPKPQIGEEVEVEIDMDQFGRIAAQTARQIVVQKMKEMESDHVFEQYKDKVGEVISGTVDRFEGDNIIVDIGEGEALMPYREQVFKETWRRGDIIKVYIVDVKKASKLFQVIVSRTHPGLLKKLLEMEVPEFKEGILQIKAIGREPGYRAKVAVTSNQSVVDAIGSCIGMRGSRIQSIVRELQGERIDIIEWSPDTKQLIINTLGPARIQDITLYESDKRAMVMVSDDQLSLAIGKKGQNVRLASKLSGWHIDVRNESRLAKEKQEAMSVLVQVQGVGEKVAEALVEHGFFTPMIIAASSVSSLVKVPGIGDKLAEKIIEKMKEFIKNNPETDKQEH